MGAPEASLPLYRQSAILAREGVEVERATHWLIGRPCRLVAGAAGSHDRRICAGCPGDPTDDTPAPLLSPGLGRTRTGRLWVYLADERSWQGPRATAAWYRFNPDRKGERPRNYLAGFEGTIQADAYTGYTALTRESGAPGRNLSLYITDGRIGIDNNPAERALRGIAITRKNYLFLGSEAGGERAAIIYTMLETAKLNGLDPEAYLANIIDRMVKGYPANRLTGVLPWSTEAPCRTCPVT